METDEDDHYPYPGDQLTLVSLFMEESTLMGTDLTMEDLHQIFPLLGMNCKAATVVRRVDTDYPKSDVSGYATYHHYMGQQLDLAPAEDVLPPVREPLHVVMGPTGPTVIQDAPNKNENMTPQVGVNLDEMTPMQRLSGAKTGGQYVEAYMAVTYVETSQRVLLKGDLRTLFLIGPQALRMDATTTANLDKAMQDMKRHYPEAMKVGTSSGYWALPFTVPAENHFVEPYQVDLVLSAARHIVLRVVRPIIQSRLEAFYHAKNLGNPVEIQNNINTWLRNAGYEWAVTHERKAITPQTMPRPFPKRTGKRMRPT
jgi:hypothetical protein